MHYTIDNITALIGARRFGNAEASIEWLLTDSRSLAFPETTLFFALRTKLGDGHLYIHDLYRRGVRNFVVGQVPAEHETTYPDANFLLVVSPLKALQRLAERHREEYNVPVIGVTGSNGKTVVKEWLYQLLSPLMHVTRSPRSYNSPTIGIMTNIGPAHQENFSTIQEKCLEKISLFKDADVIIYCADDEIINECMSSSPFSGDTIAWSRRNHDALLYVSSVHKEENATTRIAYRYLGLDYEMCIPFTDEASIENSIHCLAACLYLRIATGSRCSMFCAIT